MKKARILSYAISLLAMTLAVATAQAEDRIKMPSVREFAAHKRFFDDPRPFVDSFYKSFIPRDAYEKLTYDVEAMKATWAKAVGFRAPDLVGKIAPEITPGKYRYQDKERYPGLKALMPPFLYDMFKPGAPPFPGNFPEITIVPTRQYYFALPLGEATIKYAGQSKLDGQGYLVEKTYVPGIIPFPQPSGPFKAQQIMYNVIKSSLMFDNTLLYSQVSGYTGKLVRDGDGIADTLQVKLSGRLTIGATWLV